MILKKNAATFTTKPSICRTCKIKPLPIPRSNAQRDCSDCQASQQERETARLAARRRGVKLDVLLKVCTYCGKPAFAWKRIKNRNPDRVGGIDPRRAVCYGCTQPEALKARRWANAKRWREQNPERWKAIQRADYAKYPERYLKHTRARTKAITKLLEIADGLTPAAAAELLAKAQRQLAGLKQRGAAGGKAKIPRTRIRIGRAVEAAMDGMVGPKRQARARRQVAAVEGLTYHDVTRHHQRYLRDQKRSR